MSISPNEWDRQRLDVVRLSWEGNGDINDRCFSIDQRERCCEDADWLDRRELMSDLKLQRTEIIVFPVP